MGPQAWVASFIGEPIFGLQHLQAVLRIPSISQWGEHLILSQCH